MRPNPRSPYIPISKRERGGATARFSLTEFPGLVPLLNTSPTTMDVMTYLRSELDALGDLRTVTRSVVTRLAQRNSSTLSKDPRVVYAPRPGEIPLLDPELKDTFDHNFSLVEASDASKRIQPFVSHSISAFVHCPPRPLVRW